jgi:phosphomannomutase/phosphoglucomutase
LVDELPKYHLSKTKVPLPREYREWVVQQVREELANEAQRLVTVDGVKAYYADGWLLVRPSGTEPICRVFAEGASAGRAKGLMDRGAQLVNQLVAHRPP